MFHESHNETSVRVGGKYINTCLRIWRTYFFFFQIVHNCTWIVKLFPPYTVYLSGTLCATPSWSFFIVLKGCSSLHLIFTTHCPQGDLGNVLLQALHGSWSRPSWRESLCHWAFWLHLIVSRRRWCWPQAGTNAGQWFYSPAAVSKKPF